VREQSDRLHEALTRRDFASITPFLTPWEFDGPFARQVHEPTNLAEGVRRAVENLNFVSHAQSQTVIEVRGVNMATVDLFLTCRGTWRCAHRVFQTTSIDRLR